MSKKTQRKPRMSDYREDALVVYRNLHGLVMSSGRQDDANITAIEQALRQIEHETWEAAVDIITNDAYDLGQMASLIRKRAKESDD